ncbi:MAG: FAD-binding protein [Candidatus Omnitrophota bacterium]
MNWWKRLKGRVKLAEPLNNYTTFKIGGPAELLVEPKDPDDLKLLLKSAKRHNLPLFVIGAGSNLLVSDKGISGVVVRLSAPYFNKLSRKANYLEVGSGVSLDRVIIFARDHGLSGAEFLAGIPATVGGALAMNAGISEKVQSL